MASLAAADRRSSDTTSPELALVDPLLGQRVRERLPEPSDTLARIDLDLTRRRLTALAENAVAPREQHVPKRWSSRTPPPSRLLVASGLVAAGLVAVLLVGVNVDVRGTPAGADSTSAAPLPAQASTQVPTTQPRRAVQNPPKPSFVPTRAKPHPAIRTQPPAARRFAWAPVPGATGYRVEFFRGDKRVFSTATTEAQLTLSGSWSFSGRTQRLVPGTYHWYVWPIVGGLRQSKATVQASLAVP